MSDSFRYIGHHLFLDNYLFLDNLKIMPPDPSNKVYFVFHVRYFVEHQQRYVMTHFSEVAGGASLDVYKEDDIITCLMHPQLTRLNVSKLYLEEILSRDLFEEMHRPCYANMTWLGVVVVIDILKTQEQNQNKTAATRRLPPIQAFKKVRVGGEEDLHIIDDLCPICLEETSVGAEFIRLPCSHMYHCLCIAHWVTTSNSCPLCRQPFTTLPDLALHFLLRPTFHD